MLKHLSIDPAYDEVGILAVKWAYLDALPVTAIKLPDKCLNKRFQQCLQERGIFILSGLVTHSESYLLNLKGFNPRILAELKVTLSRFDLDIGYEVDDILPPDDNQVDVCIEIHKKVVTKLREEMATNPFSVDVLLV